MSENGTLLRRAKNFIVGHWLLVAAAAAFLFFGLVSVLGVAFVLLGPNYEGLSVAAIADIGLALIYVLLYRRCGRIAKKYESRLRDRLRVPLLRLEIALVSCTIVPFAALVCASPWKNDLTAWGFDFILDAFVPLGLAVCFCLGGVLLLVSRLADLTNQPEAARRGYIIVAAAAAFWVLALLVMPALIGARE